MDLLTFCGDFRMPIKFVCLPSMLISSLSNFVMLICQIFFVYNWEGAWTHHCNQTVEFVQVFRMCLRNKDSIVARTSYGCSLCAESFAYRWWFCVDHCTQTRLGSWLKQSCPVPILFLFGGCVDAANVQRCLCSDCIFKIASFAE